MGVVRGLSVGMIVQGIMGWMQTKFPERFGIVVDPSTTQVGSQQGGDGR